LDLLDVSTPTLQDEAVISNWNLHSSSPL